MNIDQYKWFKVLPHFYTIWIQRHIIFEKIFSPNLRNMSHRLTGIFGRKSIVGPPHILYIVVRSKVWIGFDNFWT